MISVDIIAIGKLKEDYLKKGCEEYAKRLTAFCKFNIIEISEERLPENPSEGEIKRSLEQESSRILSAIPKKAFVISLCIEGKQMSSGELSSHIDNISLSGTGRICFVIGGSHGLSDSALSKSDMKLSFSKMTFPHQLFRLMLTEQIYRAFQISSNGKYHK